jgi:murein DD-endopeptidase MepM/ murein hydrolase activator NlpD
MIIGMAFSIAATGIAPSHAETALAINGAEIVRGTAVEGGLIIAQTTPGNRVEIDGNAVPISEDGLFLIGFHHQSDEIVRVDIIDGQTRQSTRLTALQRQYDIQRIDGLASKMVTPPDDVIARIKNDQKMVREARQRVAPLGNFVDGFEWPVRGRISGVFGSQRILNGKPRQPHYGIDIAAPRGTPVLAPASGKVTLVMDLYYSGWTILMAHGLGLNSSFLHLDQVAVSTGETVAKGAVLGWVGSSGRSTGPHLDWRLDWMGRRLDAALIAEPMPE